MPIGIIVVSLTVLLGGIIGAVLGNRLPKAFNERMEQIMGLCSLCMGINAVVLLKSLPAVVLSVVLGTALGLAIRLGDHIRSGAVAMQKGISKVVKTKSILSPEAASAAMVTVITVFCASGTGIYGAMVEGFSGDHSILLAKAVLDAFTAVVFACNLGLIVSLVAVPQFCILFLLFLSAGWILPFTTPDMIANFKACGGFLMVATGLRMMKIKDLPVADMIPAMVLVMPISVLFL